MSLSEALPTTAIDTVSEFTRLSARLLEATVSDGLAQGPYVAAKAGFKTATLCRKASTLSMRHHALL